MDKKIKVLRVISRLNVGGPAIHAVLLTKGLSGPFFESELVCGSVSKEEADMFFFADKYKIMPLIIETMGRRLNLKNDLLSLRRLCLIIKRFQPDIVHTHTAKAGVLGRVAAVICGVPYRVHTFHGHIFYGYFPKIQTDLFIFIERLLALFTSRIIAVSDKVNSELLAFKIGSQTKNLVIPLGIELTDLVSLEAKSPEGEFKIGIVGRLTKIKNHKLFLRIAEEFLELEKLGKVRRNIKFVIVGDGELRRELDRHRSERGLVNTEFAGLVTEPVKIYRNLDIVVLTSDNEGTPVSLIEAMAAAKPVVATNVGGVSDIVNEERGILVKPGDLDGFVKALLKLVLDPSLRNKLGESGRNFVRNSFSKDRLFRDTACLYTSLIEER